MTTKVMVEMEWEQIDAIVVQELKGIHTNLTNDLNKLDNDESRLAVFDHDEIKERALLKEHIAACKLLLAYYGVEV